MNWKTIIFVFILCISMQMSAWAADEMQTVTDPVKVFEAGYLQVVGASEEGQSRYRALRAAQVVAQRDLLEVMQGLQLFGSTTVKDGMLESDDIKTSVEGFLKGALKCGQTFDQSKGYAEVCMRLNIRGKGGLYDIILPLLTEEKLMPEEKPSFNSNSADLKTAVTDTESSGPALIPDAKAAVKAPSELTNPHDGLIIDARDFEFRPALVNRVLSENDEVLFEPSKILSNVLVERGCGGFTTDDGKARALLESWGSKNPMIVKCTDVRKFTDARIAQDDAAAIFVNDQKSNLLSQARVVFILK